ncbi:MAG: hypothetical protein V9G19_17965 [Tetrasphaera sp.]
MSGSVVTVLVYLLVPLAVLAVALSDSTTARAARLANFTRHQGVPVTEANATCVSDSLGRSRRWRRVGVAVTLLSGLQISIAYGSWEPTEAHQSTSTGWLTLFCGWFAGLLLAEWRAGLTWLGAGMLSLIGTTYDPFRGGAFGHNAGGWGVLLALGGCLLGLRIGTSPTPRLAATETPAPTATPVVGAGGAS